MGNLREASNKTWSSKDTIECINAGSLQRIADACESMSKNYRDLISERDMYKKWYNEEKRYKETSYRRNSALKGVITKLKKRIDKD